MLNKASFFEVANIFRIAYQTAKIAKLSINSFA